MATIFTKIINGEIPSYKIAEDDNFYSFLDINPLSKGHTLVVPKKEIDYLFDVNDETIGEMMIFAKKIAKAIDKAVDCIRVGVVVIGTEVPHAHIHLIPFKNESELCFDKEKLKLSDEEFKIISESIKAEL